MRTASQGQSARAFLDQDGVSLILSFFAVLQVQQWGRWQLCIDICNAYTPKLTGYSGSLRQTSGLSGR